MVVIVTAKTLTKRCSLSGKDLLELGKSWAQSLFRCLGSIRCMKTTANWKFQSRLKKKQNLNSYIKSSITIEKHQIPLSLTINFDQTLSKYVQVSSTIMDQKGEINVKAASITDKRSITAMFSINLEDKFLPMQLIYQSKTGQSLPKVKFSESFSLGVVKSHYSNENETLKSI